MTSGSYRRLTVVRPRENDVDAVISLSRADRADLRRVPMGPDATALVYVGTAHRDEGAA